MCVSCWCLSPSMQHTRAAPACLRSIHATCLLVSTAVCRSQQPQSAQPLSTPFLCLPFPSGLWQDAAYKAPPVWVVPQGGLGRGRHQL